MYFVNHKTDATHIYSQYIFCRFGYATFWTRNVASQLVLSKDEYIFLLGLFSYFYYSDPQIRSTRIKRYILCIDFNQSFDVRHFPNTACKKDTIKMSKCPLSNTISCEFQSRKNHIKQIGHWQLSAGGILYQFGNVNYRTFTEQHSQITFFATQPKCYDSVLYTWGCRLRLRVSFTLFLGNFIFRVLFQSVQGLQTKSQACVTDHHNAVGTHSQPLYEIAVNFICTYSRRFPSVIHAWVSSMTAFITADLWCIFQPVLFRKQAFPSG